MKKNRAYNNTLILKALEDTDEELAIKAISDPQLDGEELSEILTNVIMGNVINKDTKEPLKLSNKVLGAGLLNKINQLESKLKQSDD